MFGYVLPRRDRLSEEAQVRYHAAYCGLCRALKLEYGFAARFLVNYDMTFLYFLLREGDPACRALLLPGPAVVPQGLPAGGRRHALCSRPERAAFVVEAARRPARQPRPAPSGCQSGPAALSPELSPRLGPASGARCRIRHGACPAAGARGRKKAPASTARRDAFASLLRDCAAHYDGRERRPEQLLLYHVGRYLYLADALEDLPRDVRAGAYNPLRYRYGADGGTLDPADRAQLLETIDASISMPARPWSCWTGGATGSCFPTSYISDCPPCSMQSRRERSARRETGGKHEGPL